MTHRKHGKAFFFEKKDQKAFIGADADSSGKVCVSADKSFLVLFLEKGLLAFYESRSKPIGIREYIWWRAQEIVLRTPRFFLMHGALVGFAALHYEKVFDLGRLANSHKFFASF